MIRTERPKGRPAAEALTDRILFQALNALHFVHTHDPPVIHRDIKPPNILYQDNRFLLADFGIAMVMDESRTRIGTSWYAAPEVVDGTAEQTPKVDIYSLGMTVVECLVDVDSMRTRLSPLQWH